jgi:thiamine biosynthesis lipoprotein
MATRFEIVLHGDNPVALRAAGEEALDEIERLEAQLSLYRVTSEIAHLNARAASQPVRVTPDLFALLQQAQKLHQETGGAFDISIAPLVRCWGFMEGSGRFPNPEELAEARAKVGMHLVQLDEQGLTVKFARDGVMLDLGAIGKGYAIERAAERLREAGVASALLHGGTSSVYGLGRPPDAEFWKVAVAGTEELNQLHKLNGLHGLQESEEKAAGEASGSGGLYAVPLKDESLSVSAVWGKYFEAEGKTFGHVLDPRSGQPVAGAVLAAVVLPSATETDALSTALLAIGSEEQEKIINLRPGMRSLLLSEHDGSLKVQANGITAHFKCVGEGIAEATDGIKASSRLRFY